MGGPQVARRKIPCDPSSPRRTRPCRVHRGERRDACKDEPHPSRAANAEASRASLEPPHSAAFLVSPARPTVPDLHTRTSPCVHTLLPTNACRLFSSQSPAMAPPSLRAALALLSACLTSLRLPCALAACSAGINLSTRNLSLDMRTTISLIKQSGATSIKLFSAEPKVFDALSGTPHTAPHTVHHLHMKRAPYMNLHACNTKVPPFLTMWFYGPDAVHKPVPKCLSALPLLLMGTSLLRFTEVHAAC